MKSLIFIILLCFGGFFVSAQQTTVEEDIRQMLELSGSGKLGIQVMENMTGQFRQALPDVPGEFWEEMMKEFKAEELIDLIIPIYKKHFTQAEIQQLIAFYKTPIGQKVTATLPIIASESMQIGQQWGQEIGQKVARRLQEKGYIKN